MSAREPFRWGLIGCGDLAAKRLAQALHVAAGSELAGLWGRDPERAAIFADRHGIPQAHDSLATLLASGIDGVYVCTPPDSHAGYTLAAIDAGKHVLVEKPMAATVEECERMTVSAQQKGVTLGVAYYRRAYPKMQKIKALLADGVIGTPTWVNIANHSWFNPEPGDPKYWRVEKSRSGGAGALADVGVHRLDLLDYWLGPARLIFSDRQHLVHSYEVEDGANVMLKLANGAPVNAYFAWSSQVFLDRFEIVGSEGGIVADPLDGPTITVTRGREREDLRIDAPPNAHVPCVEDFIRAVREKREPLCGGEAGLRTNRLLAQIVETVSR